MVKYNNNFNKIIFLNKRLQIFICYLCSLWFHIFRQWHLKSIQKIFLLRINVNASAKCNRLKIVHQYYNLYIILKLGTYTNLKLVFSCGTYIWAARISEKEMGVFQEIFEIQVCEDKSIIIQQKYVREKHWRHIKGSNDD